MAPRSVDPAIPEALGLDPATTKIVSHGGSGFSSTFKLSGVKCGRDVTYFVKTGTGRDAEVMFRGEHASLNAIHAAVPSLCPRSHAHGPLRSSPNTFFLATDFLDLTSSSSSYSAQSTRGFDSGSGSGLSLAAKLAKLHTTPAPPPPVSSSSSSSSTPMFGFPVPTCCGATQQDNTWRASWAAFYADNRLRAILRAAVRANGADAELESAVERVAAVVVPRLLGDGHLKGVVPVVVHGDLWSGNHGRGRIVGADADVDVGAGSGSGSGVEEEEEEVVFDPSCVYGHAEYELGIMRMFGGFGAAFWSEYEALVPRAEPAGEWEDRVVLYELYHYLNHYVLFGGGYRSGAMSIMRKLIAKYGRDS